MPRIKSPNPPSLKPRPDFPLTPHRASKQWCKKIKGRIIYFGPLEDPDTALAKYVRERDEWQAGLNPREKVESVTMEEMCNHFLEDKADKVASKELTPRTLADYYRTCQSLCDYLGKTRQAASLTEDSLAKVRAKFATLEDGTPAGLITLMNHIRRLKTLFYFAEDKGWMPKELKQSRLKKILAIPSKKSRRIERNTKGPRVLSAEHIRKILGAASLSMRAMTLLGLNAALGAADLSALPERALDLDGGWLNYARVKTGIERRVPLWPETVETLREVLAKPRKVKDPEAAGKVFVTQQGELFVGYSPTGKYLDAVGLTFSRLLKRLAIHSPGVGFYTLRHMFESVGGETEAQTAVDHVMGHSPPDSDMSAHYREFISDARLKRVTDHVRGWLWPEGSEAAWMAAEAEAVKPKRGRPRKASSKPVPVESL